MIRIATGFSPTYCGPRPAASPAYCPPNPLPKVDADLPFIDFANPSAPTPSAAHLLIGPLPDFSPLSGIALHSMSRELCPDLLPALERALGHRVDPMTFGYEGPRGGCDTSLVWTRDYLPITVHGADGNDKVVSYLSPNPKRSAYSGGDWLPMAPPAPAQQFYRGANRWLTTTTMPLLHEDGNLVSSGRHVFVTDKLLSDNARPHVEPHLRQAGYRARSSDEVLDLLAQATATPRDRIVVLPRMPGEKTGHVDLYLMALNERELMVPQIKDEAIQATGMQHERELGRSVQTFLDERSRQLEGLGYHVHRLPMMAPVYLQPSDHGWNGVFYSPTNALLLPTKDRQEVLVPTWDPQGFPENYRALNSAYQQEWGRFFESKGWHPEFVDATRLGKAYGLLRCLTHRPPGG